MRVGADGVGALGLLTLTAQTRTSQSLLLLLVLHELPIPPKGAKGVQLLSIAL